MTTKKTRYGRTWVVVMIVIILGLPLITVFFLKEGFKIREEVSASDLLYADSTIALPDYQLISHRGDTITKNRMLGKVCVLDFISYSCGKSIDDKQRLLFELQEDYYGKTKGFRVLSATLTPEQDSIRQIRLMSERYAGREIWHFLRSDDSTAVQLFQFCKSSSKNNSDTDLFCPGFVYLIDGNGNVRGSYDPMVKNQYDALYKDILFLINQLYAEETD